MVNNMLLICYGTRPEWIKVKPIIDELKNSGIEYKTLFTGQHKDLVSNRADYMLPPIVDVSRNRLDNIVSSILKSVDGILDNFDYIMVQGDTTSVLSIAIAAFHRNKKIIHLEAGLRTHDNNNPYPEEFNRSAVSRITDIHLCPTKQSKQNLLAGKKGRGCLPSLFAYWWVGIGGFSGLIPRTIIQRSIAADVARGLQPGVSP